jgi:hypothetical protein
MRGSPHLQILAPAFLGPERACPWKRCVRAEASQRELRQRSLTGFSQTDRTVPDSGGQPGHPADPGLRTRILTRWPDASHWSTDLKAGVRVPPSAPTSSQLSALKPSGSNSSPVPSGRIWPHQSSRRPRSGGPRSGPSRRDPGAHTGIRRLQGRGAGLGLAARTRYGGLGGSERPPTRPVSSASPRRLHAGNVPSAPTGDPR